MKTAHLLTAALLLTGTGCVHSVDSDPLPPLTVPKAFSELGQNDPGVDAPDRWWEAFGDSELNQMVEGTLQGNLQLKEAWARLEQADAMITKATSGLFPSVNVEASASRSVAVRTFPSPTGGSTSVSVDSRNYGLSGAASYEVDIWGRIRGQRAAALLDWEASRDEVEAVAMTLVARLTDTWFGFRSENASVLLLRKQLETNERFLELIELRFRQGLAESLDVHQQRQQVAASRAQLELAQARRSVFKNQLAVLLGYAPQALRVEASASELPDLPGLPGVGVPVHLLERRPDIRSARRRVEAADERVGVALADMFPSLRLSGNLGYGAPTLSSVFENLVWGVLGSLTQPLFEGGRRKAEYSRSQAALREKIHGYGRVLLEALAEVENALVNERRQSQHLLHVREQEKHARRALNEARSRYEQGLADFLRVLTALQALQRAEQSSIGAHRQLLAYRVELCRALGGSWMSELKIPEDAATEQARESAPQVESEATEQI